MNNAAASLAPSTPCGVGEVAITGEQQLVECGVGQQVSVQGMRPYAAAVGREHRAAEYRGMALEGGDRLDVAVPQPRRPVVGGGQDAAAVGREHRGGDPAAAIIPTPAPAPGLTEEAVAAIDAWIDRQHEAVTRSEAIRRLLEQGPRWQTTGGAGDPQAMSIDLSVTNVEIALFRVGVYLGVYLCAFLPLAILS
jgi:hypothetical protein